MITIGVRELRQRASELLREVEAGQTVQVTDRGRPVALLVRVPSEGPLARLEAEGRVSRPIGDFLDLGPPLKPAPGVPLPSESLERARRDER